MDKPLTMGDIRKKNIKTLLKSITDGTYGGSQRYTSRFTNKDQTDTRAKMMQGLREQMEELKARIEERENNYTQRSMCYSEDETDDEEDDFIPSNNYRDCSEENREPYRELYREPYQTDARTMEKPLTMGDYFHMDRESHGDFNKYRPYESSDSEDDQENSNSDETSQMTLPEPEIVIIGEIDTYPTTLIIPTKQPFVDFVGMDWDKTEQMDVITDNPPIMDDLNVINNVDHVYEPTANMLSDIAHDWEDLLFYDREEELAIPSFEDFIDPIEDDMQVIWDATEDGNNTDDEQDSEEVLKELERLIYENHLVCEPIYVRVPEKKSLDNLQTTPPPPPRQTGKFPNFHISKFPVCTKLISLGLKSVLHLHNKLGLRNWKATKKKPIFKNALNFCLVVISTTSLVKARNKFGKGYVGVPFDNG